MSDQNTRFLLPEHHVRGQIVKLDHSYQAILANAEYPPAVASLLGQALAAVGALASIIKLRGSMILQVQGDGPIHTLVAQANNAGEIRGLAHGFTAVTNESSFSQLQGKGRLVMTVDGEGSKRYQGIVEITGERLADALDTYFAQSEQLATHIHLAADGKQAACYLLQQLPGGAAAEAEQSWQHVKTLSETLRDAELLHLDDREILHRLFHEEDVQLFDASTLSFRCRCSRAKVVPVIEQMGYEAAMQLVEEQGEIRADCEFCNQAHRFDRVDVASLFKADISAPSTSQ